MYGLGCDVSFVERVGLICGVLNGVCVLNGVNLGVNQGVGTACVWNGVKCWGAVRVWGRSQW